MSTPANAAEWRAYRARRKAEGRPVRGGLKMTKAEFGQFIAIDGEGADFGPSDHRYILVNAYAPDGRHYTISDQDGLDCTRVLSFLAALGARYPQAIAVMFASGYDTVMMLRGILTPAALGELWQRAKMAHPDGKRLMRIGRFLIGYQPRRQLYIYDCYARCGITIWDVWGFFQTSFGETLRSWLPSYPYTDDIVRMKRRRSAFEPSQLPEIERYCRLECEALALVMRELHAALVACDLRLNRWDGAGAVAAALFRKYDIKRHISAEIPPAVRDASRHAYYGGRIETYRYGAETCPIYAYDINSAYPSVIRDLPSLDGGTWRHWDRVPVDPHTMTMVRVEWSLQARDSTEIYPFPFRLPNGDVLFPSSGHTWVWWPEYAAYMRHRDRYHGIVAVHEAWEFVPGNSEKPFSFVEVLYETRKKWVKEGRKAEKVIKLGLNSLYGKMVQQIGGESGNPPPYFQLELGGYITSTVRARLYDVAMIDPDSTVMVATDGIYTLAPRDVPILPEKVLGLWQMRRYERAIIVQSGVYWLYAADGTCTGRTSGYSTDFRSVQGLTPDRVVAAWQRGDVALDCEARRKFVGFGEVVAGQRPYEQLGSWQSSVKRLSLRPEGKRWCGIDVARGWRAIDPSRRLEISAASPNPYDGWMTRPHPIAWLEVDSAKIERDMLVRAEVAC
jgi:hypothetical protein